MVNKYKLIVLTFVGIAVLAILFISHLPSLTPGAEEEAAPTDAVFKPADDPYAAYTEALEDEKPVVLEFYARW